jgi:hypothetical protein
MWEGVMTKKIIQQFVRFWKCITDDYAAFTLAILGAVIFSCSFLFELKYQGYIQGVSYSLIGGGAASAILQASQFTEFFKKSLFEVIYDPIKAIPISTINSKWDFLTDKLLSPLLPNESQQITSLIRNKYLESELDYYYQEAEFIYDIKINKSSKVAISTTKFKTKIITSNNSDKAVVFQKFSENDGVKLIEAFINDEKVVATIDPYEDNTKKLEIDLSDYDRDKVVNGGEIEFERTVDTTQCLKNDVIISAMVPRYVKGAKVVVSITSGYKVQFKSVHNCPEPVDKSDGSKTWVLAKNDELLCPGQLFLMAITEDKK